MSSSNYWFLTCIQISQEASQVVWYSHLFQNFPQFIVICTVKGFGIVNKAKIDVFLELSWFFDDPADVDNLISGPSAFSKTSLNIWKFICIYVYIHMCMQCMCAKSFQSCLTLSDTRDYSLPGSSDHGFLQARVLEWVAMPSFRESSRSRDWTPISYVSCIGRWVLYH